MGSIQSLLSALADSQQAILEHPLYRAVRTESQLQAFMEQHCFAVWDFMSLLKALQRRLTSVELPWRPVGDAESRRLINEIVLGEECDEDGRGSYLSHFELYLNAMHDCGADTAPLQKFLGALECGILVPAALAHVPQPARDFVAANWELLQFESTAGLASAFAFGREDLVPKMFLRLVQTLRDGAPQRWERFMFYLERHIQLDSESHYPMAERLLTRLCGHDTARWAEAERAAKRALQARLQLWDGLVQRINSETTLP